MDASEVPLIVFSRFRVSDEQAPSFAADARAAIAVLAERDGFIDAALGQCVDDAGLRTIMTRWMSVGAYRRALSNPQVKMTAIPFLSLAIDEPSAFEVVHARTPDGAIDAVSGLAADAGSIGLGFAAGPSIPPVAT
jgi:hypothetical protein